MSSLNIRCDMCDRNAFYTYDSVRAICRPCRFKHADQLPEGEYLVLTLKRIQSVYLERKYEVRPKKGREDLDYMEELKCRIQKK